MKYCPKCGKELGDDVNFCPACGSDASGMTTYTPVQNTADDNTLKTVAKVFMVIGCIASAFMFLIPLAWTLPMTIYYFNRCKDRQPVGVGFKVCTLLFVNTIAGILMLCDRN